MSKNSKPYPPNSPEEATALITEEIRNNLRERFSGMKNTPAIRQEMKDSTSRMLKRLLPTSMEVEAEVDPRDPSRIIVTTKTQIPPFLVHEFELEPGTMAPLPDQLTMPTTETKKIELIRCDPEFDWDWD